MVRLHDLAAVIGREHDALAAETRIARCPPLVAVNDMDDVSRVPSALRWNHSAAITSLPESDDAAFIVDCPSLNSTVLWVATNSNKYRVHYRNFLNTTYGLELSAIPSRYDVDHLYNRSRAQI